MSKRLSGVRVDRRLLAEAAVALAIIGMLTLNLQRSGLTMNSRMWPLVILGAMGAVALTLMASAFSGRNSVPDGDVGVQDPAVPGERELPFHRYGMMAAYAALILVLPYIGFALSTVVFVPVAARILGMPLRAKPVALALVTGLAIYLLFTFAFHVPLPKGVAGHLGRWIGIGGM